MALQKAFHAGNDGVGNEADHGDAHGRHQGIDVDCTTLKNTVRESIRSAITPTFHKAFKGAEGDVRKAVRQAAVQQTALEEATQHHHSRPFDEERQEVTREAFFEAFPRNLEEKLCRELRPKLYRILRRHFDSDDALAVLNVACLVAAPSPDTYLSGATNETGPGPNDIIRLCLMTQGNARIT